MINQTRITWEMATLKPNTHHMANTHTPPPPPSSWFIIHTLLTYIHTYIHTLLTYIHTYILTYLQITHLLGQSTCIHRNLFAWHPRVWVLFLPLGLSSQSSSLHHCLFSQWRFLFFSKKISFISINSMTLLALCYGLESVDLCSPSPRSPRYTRHWSVSLLLLAFIFFCQCCHWLIPLSY